jgi:hypothetical protein
VAWSFSVKCRRLTMYQLQSFLQFHNVKLIRGSAFIPATNLVEQHNTVTLEQLIERDQSGLRQHETLRVWLLLTRPATPSSPARVCIVPYLLATPRHLWNSYTSGQESPPSNEVKQTRRGTHYIKCKVVCVLNQLNIRPRRCKEQWKCSCTIPENGTRWRWVVHLTPQGRARNISWPCQRSLAIQLAAHH